MQIEVKIDAGCSEPKVLIITNCMTDEINEMIKRLSEQQPSVITGFKGEDVLILEPSEIVRIYATNQRVYAVSESGEYGVKLRLYELENRLPSSDFVRISNSEIINLKKVKGFDLSFTGTICVKFQDGGVSYVSRRYVSKIKQILGI
jgi:DNA-binding LytR/AlgR family response regulator